MSDGTTAALPHRRTAAFLDRDGTLIEDPFRSDSLPHRRTAAPPHLIPGAGAAVARLNAAGIAVFVVTNQAGIARGLISWEEYRAASEGIDRLLALEGARLDGTYICPHAPEVDGPCPCRKPEIALFVQAAEEHGLDMAGSWWAGDRLSDLLPSSRFAGSGVLVLTGNGPAHRERAADLGFPAVAGLGEVVDRILERSG